MLCGKGVEERECHVGIFFERTDFAMESIFCVAQIVDDVVNMVADVVQVLLVLVNKIVDFIVQVVEEASESVSEMVFFLFIGSTKSSQGHS